MGLPNQTGRKLRLVIVDDDPKFCALMAYIGVQRNIIVTTYTTVDDLDLDVVMAADVLAVDFNLGATNGVAISQTLRANNITTPTLLISASQDAFQVTDWPESIAGFTSKDLGPFAVLDSLLQVARRRLAAPA